MPPQGYPNNGVPWSSSSTLAPESGSLFEVIPLLEVGYSVVVPCVSVGTPVATPVTFHLTDKVDCLVDRNSCACSIVFLSFSDSLLPSISLNCRALITAAPP
jgi:hypothetical protein